ncbi:hypothetical protein [Bacillus smithii]|uniref:hypothetical protein n=1 Tax=Bacillus smithii TaxID=1479 RepID=UPI0022E1E25D|nr:hypothetical protein [Bacillus smithii]
MPMFYWCKELVENEVENIKNRIEKTQGVRNIKLLKTTPHSLIFEGVRGDSKVGFVHPKNSVFFIEEELYGDFLD